MSSNLKTRPASISKLLLSGSILKYFFYLLYHQFAWLYDLVAAVVSGGRWRDWIQSPLPYLEGPAILEIGHGPGHLLQALAEQGQHVYGIDESLWMNHVALRRIRKTTTTTVIINGYAQYLPFGEASFNQVVSTFPAEYILDPSTLYEVRRVLLPGGCFIVVPFAWITGRRFSDLLGRLLFRLTGQVPSRIQPGQAPASVQPGQAPASVQPGQAPAWDERFLSPFRQAGFETEYRFVEVNQSTVMVIRAFKLD